MTLPDFGRYKSLEEIGRGAMGVVYRAMDPAIGRAVAVKAIQTSFLENVGVHTDEYLKRFQREAEVAGRLNHPNIVKIYDLGPAYLVMEFVEGETLEAMIRARTRLPLSRMLEIVGQAAEGLDYAHSQGIIHRDVKPSNIMIQRDGVVKIMDFGLARIDSSKLTATGAILGSASYMSPEMILGKTALPQSDIFGLGVVAYELMTGDRPFEGNSVSKIIHNIVKESPSPAHARNLRVPPEYDGIFSKVFAKDPAQRHATAGEFVDDLVLKKWADQDPDMADRPARAGEAPPEAAGTVMEVSEQELMPGAAVAGDEPRTILMSASKPGAPTGGAPAPPPAEDTARTTVMKAPASVPPPPSEDEPRTILMSTSKAGPPASGAPAPPSADETARTAVMKAPASVPPPAAAPPPPSEDEPRTILMSTSKAGPPASQAPGPAPAEDTARTAAMKAPASVPPPPPSEDNAGTVIMKGPAAAAPPPVPQQDAGTVIMAAQGRAPAPPAIPSRPTEGGGARKGTPPAAPSSPESTVQIAAVAEPPRPGSPEDPGAATVLMMDPADIHSALAGPRPSEAAPPAPADNPLAGLVPDVPPPAVDPGPPSKPPQAAAAPPPPPARASESGPKVRKGLPLGAILGVVAVLVIGGGLGAALLVYRYVTRLRGAEPPVVSEPAAPPAPSLAAAPPPETVPPPSTAPEAPPAEAAPAAAPPESVAPPTTAAPALATLSVVSDPDGARVSVARGPRGTTPLRLQLRPGRWSLTVEKEGFKVWKRDVALAPGARESLRADLQPLPKPAPAPAAPAAAPSGVVPLTPDVTPPKRVSGDAPEAPKRSKQSGSVLLEFVVNEDGTIGTITIVESGGEVLDRVCRDAVARWKYKPATLRGTPVKVSQKAKFTFQYK